MFHACVLYLLALLPLLIHASQLTNIEERLNIQQFGSQIFSEDLELLGDLDALSFYRYTGQQNFTTISTTDSLVYYSNDVLIELIENLTDSTRINKITPLGSDAFILSGQGNLLNLDLSRQLVYNLTDLSIFPIFSNELNNVNTILVDNDLVYFGGNFSTRDTYSAIIWDSNKNETMILPFNGFGSNSKINSIQKLNDDNLLFAGDFYTLGNSSLLLGSSTSQSQNLSSIELNPTISLGAACWSVDSSSTFDSTGFICPNANENSWENPQTTGSVNFDIPYDVTPTKLRVFNSPESDGEISLFRIVTQPSDSIMNLTYVDPVSGSIKYCDAFCPLYTRKVLESQAENITDSNDMATLLSDNTTILKWSKTYQDFAFVNSVEMSSFTFMALESYGSSVALAGLQLYQNSFNSFANNTLNEPNCNNTSAVTSSSLSNSNWTLGLEGDSYISANYTPYLNPVPSVEFLVELDYSGEYTLVLYTPGCSNDNTCGSRGIMNVTVWNTNDNSIISTNSIYQNNEQLKYDTLYSGYLDNSCKVTLTYLSGIYADSTPVTVVADRVSLSITELNVLNLTSNSSNSPSKIKLNGVFQYQLSNFTSPFDSSNPSVAETSLMNYAVDYFNSNSSIFTTLYDNNTLLVGNSNQGISVLQLNNDLTISSSSDLEVEGDLTGFTSFSDGVFITGEAFNISNNESNNLIYNGSFHIFDENNDSIIINVANLTMNDSELLVLDNQYIYNVSSSSSVSNSSAFSLSLWSAGMNSADDTLMYGAISKIEYSNLNGSVSIGPNNSISKLSFPNGINPYIGLYLNDSLTVYAYESNNESRLYFSGTSFNSSWSWSNVISSLTYSSNQSMLMVGTESDSSGEAQISLLNTSTLTTIKDLSLSAGSKINSLINFELNSTVMVGGEFNISNVQCDGLCLYNYDTDKWNSFLDGAINGTITNLQFYNGTYMILSGNFDTENALSLTLAMMDLTNNEITPLRKDSQELPSFITMDDKIITWNDTDLFVYQNEVWSSVKISNVNASSSITGVNQVSVASTMSKRDDSTSNALILNGQFYDSEYGNLQSVIYNFQDWIPYLILETSNSDNTQEINAFINQDTSSLFNSLIELQNINATTTSPTPSSTQTPNTGGKNKKKIHRGFVVLIGLALALGTVAVLGLIGVILAVLFRDEEIKYQPLTPRINENDMVDTVPPEKLMRFI